MRAEIQRRAQPGGANVGLENLVQKTQLEGAVIKEDLLTIRWTAVAHGWGRWPVITDDLNALRDSWAHRDEALWGRLLVRAAERLVWTDEEGRWWARWRLARVDVNSRHGRLLVRAAKRLGFGPSKDNAMKRLMTELDKLPHFQTNLVAELDRIDYLRKIVFESYMFRRSGSSSGRPWRRLLHFWPDPGGRRLPPALQPLLGNILNGPNTKPDGFCWTSLKIPWQNLTAS